MASSPPARELPPPSPPLPPTDRDDQLAPLLPLEPLGPRTSFKRHARAPLSSSRRPSAWLPSWIWPRWLSVARGRSPDGPAHEHDAVTRNARIERALAAADPSAGGGSASLPRLLPSRDAPSGNPIPKVPFAVISCVLFGEFLCAGVASPFMFFLLADLGTLAPAQVGLWVGVVNATFFLAQFSTSLIWSRCASRYGRRAVLACSLMGSAFATIAFGTSTNLASVLAFRFAQGVFNGAVGVARAAVIDIIDPTNEARAYALLGVCWSLGGSVG